MTRKELRNYVAVERRKMLYSSCDAQHLRRLHKHTEIIISRLQVALFRDPEEYVNLRAHIGRLKQEIRTQKHCLRQYKLDGKSTVDFCKESRLDLMAQLKKIITEQAKGE